MLSILPPTDREERMPTSDPGGSQSGHRTRQNSRRLCLSLRWESTGFGVRLAWFDHRTGFSCVCTAPTSPAHPSTYRSRYLQSSVVIVYICLYSWTVNSARAGPQLIRLDNLVRLALRRSSTRLLCDRWTHKCVYSDVGVLGKLRQLLGLQPPQPAAGTASSIMTPFRGFGVGIHGQVLVQWPALIML